MTEEKDRALCAKFPKIFRDRHRDMQETCMCWGFEHGDGWYDIIDAACTNIQHHIDWKRSTDEFRLMSDEEFNEQHQTVAVQVKEKWGCLRFYVNNADDYVQGIISMAESMSCRICETCGAPGQRRTGGWVRTLCDDHAK